MRRAEERLRRRAGLPAGLIARSRPWRTAPMIPLLVFLTSAGMLAFAPSKRPSAC